MARPNLAHVTDSRKSNRQKYDTQRMEHDANTGDSWHDAQEDHDDDEQLPKSGTCRRGWNFAEMASRALRVPKLAATAALVLHALVMSADSDVDSYNYRTIKRSVPWLAYQADRSQRQVRRCLRQLEKTGIVDLQSVGTNIEVEKCNVWVFNPDVLLALTAPADEAWRNRKSEHERTMERAREQVAATNDHVHAVMAAHYGRPIGAPTKAAPKSTRKYHTKATNPRIGLHHAVADRREQVAAHMSGVVSEMSAPLGDDVSADLSGNHDGFMVDQVGHDVLVVDESVRGEDTNDRLSGLTLPEDFTVQPNQEEWHDPLEDKAYTCAHTYDKYNQDNYDSEEDLALYPPWLDSRNMSQDQLVDTDVAVTPASTKAIAEATITTSQEDHVTTEVATTPTPSEHAPHTSRSGNVAKDQRRRYVTQRHQITTNKRIRTTTPTDQDAAATPPVPRNPLTLAQKPPKEASQAVEVGVNLFRSAEAHQDDASAVVARLLATAWYRAGVVALDSDEPANMMAYATGPRGPLEMRIDVTAGELAQRVSSAWHEAAHETDGAVVPSVDVLEFAVHTWFTERWLDTIGSGGDAMPRGEIPGRLCRYVKQVYRAEATGDASTLPAEGRDDWLHAWQHRHKQGRCVDGLLLRKYGAPEEPDAWLTSWANAMDMSEQDALTWWVQFRQEHEGQLALGWMSRFFEWWREQSTGDAVATG